MQDKLPFWALIVPVPLIAVYGFLIFAALGDQANFYGSMDMPQPNHGFMYISWTGKTGDWYLEPESIWRADDRRMGVGA